MKILPTILILLVSTYASSQSCDTLKFTFSLLPIDIPEWNCIDSLGRKQNWWINFRTREFEKKSLLVGQPNKIGEVVDNYSYGKYYNDKRIGKWEYIHNGGCYVIVTKTENYFDDGSIEVVYNEGKEKVNYNADSSLIKCVLEFNTDSIIIICDENDLPVDCRAIYQGRVFKQFSRHYLEFEMERVKIEILERELRKGKSH